MSPDEMLNCWRESELAIQRAGRAALIEHKALGFSIAVADGDGVRIVPPDEIVIPPEPTLEPEPPAHPAPAGDD